jgi:hypothetical protein
MNAAPAPGSLTADIPAPGAAAKPLLHPKLLAGEGREEEVFLGALMRKHAITGVQVENYGGKNQLRRYLRNLHFRSGFSGLSSLGLLRDADVDAAGAFASVQGALRDAGLPCPSTVGVWSAQKPKVGVFVLPDGSAPGMLEDLCLHSVAKDTARPCVERYFQCLDEQQVGRPENLSKARTRVWLASRERPDLLLGEAAEKGYLPLDSAVFDPLARFIQAL